jgi:hypothetical protein
MEVSTVSRDKLLECIVACSASIKIKKLLKFPRFRVEQDATDTEKCHRMTQLRALRGQQRLRYLGEIYLSE